MVSKGSLIYPCNTPYKFNPDYLKLYADEEHVNTNEQLEEEFKSMRKAGVVQLMADVMPLECLIVRHYEVFMQLLQGRAQLMC